jgi:hypothetical protein
MLILFEIDFRIIKREARQLCYTRVIPEVSKNRRVIGCIRTAIGNYQGDKHE